MTYPPFRPARPHRGRWAAVVASVAVVLAGIGVGVYFLQRGDDTRSAGAATPAGAVRTAAEAVAAQSVDELLAVTNPGETKTLGTLIDLARGKLTDTGLIAASGPLIPILHLATRGVALRTDQVNGELAFVTITGGTISATLNQVDEPAAIRPGSPVRQHVAAGLRSHLAIAVIHSDDGWFISPVTTLFEYLRQRAGLPEPNFATPQPIGRGAPTPRAALTGMLSAVQNHDLRAAAGFLSEKDVPALQYYYGTFSRQLAAGLAGSVGRASAVRTTVTDMSNGLVKLTVDSARLRVTTTNGQRGSAGYRAGCITSSIDREQHCIPSGFAQVTGIDSVFVVAENDGGAWRISPIATVLEYARIVITRGNADAFYRRADLPRLTPTTQTIRVGTPAMVRLNDGGWAHVAITGEPNTCAHTSSGRHDLQPDADSVGSSCVGLSIPASGRAGAVVYGPPYRSGRVRVRLVSR
jgi:hypothetical protein